MIVQKGKAIFHKDFPIQICHFVECDMIDVVWGNLPTTTIFNCCLISTIPDYLYVDSRVLDEDKSYMNNDIYSLFGIQVLNNITSKIVNISRSQRVLHCWRLELKKIQPITVVLDFRGRSYGQRRRDAVVSYVQGF